EDDARDVVLWLGFGQAKGIDLNPVTKPAQLGVGNPVTVVRQFIPQLAEGSQFTNFLNKTNAGVDEKADAPHCFGELCLAQFARSTDVVENRVGRAERKGDFLDRGRSSFLKMVGADIDRVPLGNIGDRIRNGVANEAQTWRWRKNISAA